ncbi:MAG: hypothetical protein HQ589_03635 [Syntrophaceae bacterium]|nr:hypothetical protein [Syntrophaceae bacterium]
MFTFNEHAIKVNKAMDKIIKNTEEKIYRRATEALQKQFPIQIQVDTVERQPGGAQNVRPDLFLKVVIEGKELHYCAEIKNVITKANTLLLLMEKERLPRPLLVIAKYVNPQAAAQLMRDGIEFIDTAGNAFINHPPIYIYVKGNRPPEIPGQMPPKRAFRPAGLKMIYAFLCNPGLENKTFREIAVIADVALGTVGWIMKELRELGFLLDMGQRRYRLIQKDILLQRWVTAYPEQLRPKQMLGRYRGEYGDWWQKKTLHPFKEQWGGEVAAAKLTQYLNPQTITIYTTGQQLNQLLLECRLKKDVAGDVEIVERFWKADENEQYGDLVHPILIYADLLTTGNQRNIETAKMIYEQHIIRLVGEN